MLPSAVIDRPVLPLASGPCELTMNRFCCSGPRSVANALRAFSDSSRKPKLIIAAPVAHARLGDDLDAHHAGFVILRGERVGVEADLLDLILRRKPAAAEAVDEESARPVRPSARSCSAISSGSSDSASISSLVSVVREAVVAPRLGADLVDDRSLRGSRPVSVAIAVLLPRLTLNGTGKPWKPSASTVI